MPGDFNCFFSTCFLPFPSQHKIIFTPQKDRPWPMKSTITLLNPVHY